MKYSISQWQLHSIDVIAVTEQEALHIACQKKSPWKVVEELQPKIGIAFSKSQIKDYSEPHRIIEMSPLCKNNEHCMHPTCTRLCCLCGFIKEFHYSKKNQENFSNA